MKKDKSSLFKSKKEEQIWLKENMLTVKDLIEFLTKFNDNTLIYVADTMTGILQHIPKDPERVFKTVKKDKASMKKSFKQWHRSTEKTKEELEKEAKKEIDEMYQNVTNDGLVLQC